MKTYRIFIDNGNKYEEVSLSYEAIKDLLGYIWEKEKSKINLVVTDKEEYISGRLQLITEETRPFVVSKCHVYLFTTWQRRNKLKEVFSNDE